MNKKRITAIGGAGLAVVLVATGAVVGGMKRAKATRDAEARFALQRSARPVALERVTAVRLEQKRGYPGIVRASEESALSFRVGGPLTKVDVVPGRPVPQGTLLMQIDPRDFEDRIRALEAQLAGVQAVQKNAKQEYDRAAGLFDEKVISQTDYDRASSAFDSADAAVETLDSQLQIARHSLKDTSLFAPYSGTVSEQLVENHEMVKSGEVVLEFHNIQWLEVAVSVPENEIVRRNMTGDKAVWVGFPALPGKKIEAKLKEWSSAADPITRTYAVTFAFEAPADVKVLPGMSAKVTWTEEPPAEAQLTVPVSALSSDAEGHSDLWIYEDGHAVRRRVRTGALAGASRVVVLEGLAEGEQVVVAGNRLITEGQALHSSLEQKADR
ncbi:MAG: efflux RND transporter periplasmic adaptor subunit [Verrucomicrobia bacterium]|nr:efflux RND transporter periplasmic adaptor subunit [Verrucomicrobiota bacterium]